MHFYRFIDRMHLIDSSKQEVGETLVKYITFRKCLDTYYITEISQLRNVQA
jgi:hypothetical protein